MYKILNVMNNENLEQEEKAGPFTVMRHKREVELESASMEKLYKGIKNRQLICEIKDSPVVLRKGEFLWSVGNITESKGKDGHPEYAGAGYIMSIPFSEYVIILNTQDFSDQLVLDEKKFYACDSSINQKISQKTNGGQQILLEGKGRVVVKSDIKKKDLTTIVIEKDTLRLKAGRALAWSATLRVQSESVGGEMVDTFSGSGKIIFY